MDISSRHIQPNRDVVARNRAMTRAFVQKVGEHSQENGAEPVGDSVDRIDVSRRGETLATVYERLEDLAADSDRESVVALKRAYEAGQLNSPERIAQAAERLLG